VFCSGRLLSGQAAFRPELSCRSKTTFRAKFLAFPSHICSDEHMNDSDVIPPSVAGCLAEIERSVERFRSSYSLGTDPERLLTDEIITMRVELIRLWSEISSGKRMHADG
jgi:hypothetical protein